MIYFFISLGFILLIAALIYVNYLEKRKLITPLSPTSKANFHRFRNRDLCNFWTYCLRPHIVKLQDPPKLLPPHYAEAIAIRNWMKRNRETLNRIQSLSYPSRRAPPLYSMPEEVFLFGNLKSLTLADCGIAVLPWREAGSFNKLQRLDLSGTQLSELPDTWLTIPNISSLHLQNTEITRLQKIPANHLMKLSFLDLRFSTQISDIDSSWLSLPHLRSLVIDSLSLDTLKWPQKLAPFEYLVLRRCALKEVPQALFKLPTLKYLDISLNKIEDLKIAHPKASSCVTLHIGYNPIRQLDRSIVSLPKLRELHANHCSLEKLPPRPTSSALRVMNLENNSLQHIPKSYFRLPRLCECNLSRNILTSLPPIPSRIEHLNLSYNKFVKIPPQFKRFPNLTTLLMNGNTEMMHPGSIHKGAFSKLETLSLSGCSLTELPKLKPKSLSALHTLDLSYNPMLSKITRDWAELPSLGFLDMTKTGLSRLPDDVSIRDLHTLRLNDNHIKEIPRSWLFGGLEHLSVCRNALQKVPPLTDLTAPKKLDFSYNLITHVPKELPKLDTDFSINLTGNAIKKIPTHVEGGATIDITDNPAAKSAKELERPLPQNVILREEEEI